MSDKKIGLYRFQFTIQTIDYLTTTILNLTTLLINDCEAYTGWCYCWTIVRMKNQGIGPSHYWIRMNNNRIIMLKKNIFVRRREKQKSIYLEWKHKLSVLSMVSGHSIQIFSTGNDEQAKVLVATIESRFLENDDSLLCSTKSQQRKYEIWNQSFNRSIFF